MPHLCSSALNVINFHDITSWTTLHSISLRLTSVNIINRHGITDELGRGCRADFDFSQLIVGVQWVISLPLGLELNDLRSGARDILSCQVGLILVEVNMECSRARSVNIPVWISELLFLGLFGAMEFGYGTYARYKKLEGPLWNYSTQKSKYLPSISLVLRLFEVLRIVPNLEVDVETWSYFLLMVARDMQSARLGIAKSPVSARWAIFNFVCLSDF